VVLDGGKGRHRAQGARGGSPVLVALEDGSPATVDGAEVPDGVHGITVNGPIWLSIRL
jgi:hypothetical protein